MTKLYKLTDANGKTRPGFDNECQWGEGVTHSGTGKGGLCSEGWVHAYTHPLLAALLNPVHADYVDARLWEAEGEIAKTDGGLKVGCVSLTTLREVPLPDVSAEQRVKFGILCALEVCEEPEFVAWAERWLSGEDRSAEAAWVAEWAVARAARAAAMAAAEAARAAETAWAAEAAARAAGAARTAKIDLVALAEKACA